MLYADVAVQAPQALDDLLFTYRVPEAMAENMAAGARVVIPFGKRSAKKDGFVLRLHNETPEHKPVKNILQLLDDEPLLLAEQIELGLWVARHYVTTPFYALSAMLPAFTKAKKRHRLTLINPTACNDSLTFSSDALTLWENIKKTGEVICNNPDDVPGARELAGTNCIAIETFYQQPNQGKRLYYYHAAVHDRDAFETVAKSTLKQAPKQRKILFDLLMNGPQSVASLDARHGSTRQTLEALVGKGLAYKKEKAVCNDPFIEDVFTKRPVESLNDAQIHAVSCISAQFEATDKKPVLLHGVTGSGKTEVYLRAMAQAHKNGQGSLLLVPEIALTTQLVGRLRGAFDEPIGIMHSQLSDGERFQMWQRIRNKEIRLVVGVRSAVFAPIPDLGLIIIDEEHESTYKQNEPEPRYHAREVAWKRASIADAVLVLGSATPSMQTLQDVHNNKALYVQLPQRVNGMPMPDMTTVDMRENQHAGYAGIFSEALLLALAQTFARGEQAILFLNRRGFSSFILCQQCGAPVKCHQCDITMTYYKNKHMLRCHYCDVVEPVPDSCPHCGASDLKFFGMGTEQVEHAFRSLFPDISCARLDHDTTRLKNAAQKTLVDFSSGHFQVLIGTQMIAKGFDFPNVTLVGLISADQSLNIADYKAAEQTFQLIVQVAGRAGRGERPGRVIIQTFNPDHYAIRLAMTYDYEGFYQQEIMIRTQLSYPPTVKLMRIIVSHANKDTVKKTAGAVKAFLQPYLEQISLLGPAAAPIERIRGRYRVQFLLKASQPHVLENIGHAILRAHPTLRKNETLRILVDMDPENIL